MGFQPIVFPSSGLHTCRASGWCSRLKPPRSPMKHTGWLADLKVEWCCCIIVRRKWWSRRAGWVILRSLEERYKYSTLTNTAGLSPPLCVGLPFHWNLIQTQVANNSNRIILCMYHNWDSKAGVPFFKGQSFTSEDAYSSVAFRKADCYIMYFRSKQKISPFVTWCKDNPWTIRWQKN